MPRSPQHPILTHLPLKCPPGLAILILLDHTGGRNLVDRLPHHDSQYLEEKNNGQRVTAVPCTEIRGLTMVKPGILVKSQWLDWGNGCKFQTYTAT